MPGLAPGDLLLDAWSEEEKELPDITPDNDERVDDRSEALEARDGDHDQEPQHGGEIQETVSESSEDSRDVTPTPKDLAEKSKKVELDSSGEDEDTDDGDEISPATVDEFRQKLGKKNREAKRLRERATAAERKAAQYEAAEQTGLPLKMASRLQGSNAEELVKDAEELLEMLGRRRAVPGSVPDDGVRRGDVRANVPEDVTDLNKVGARIYER